MNYLMESKAFYESIELNQLSSGQIALWHALFNINNKVQWQEWFSVPNSVLSLHSGLTVRGINKARNQLKQLGYIDFKTQGTKATKYRVISLVSSKASSTPSSMDSSNDGSMPSSIPSSIDGSIPSSKVGTTLNKQNKTETKPNKTKEDTPLTPQRGKSRPRPAKSVPGEVAEIVAYLNKVTGTDYKPTTKKTQQLIKARMRDGFTVADFKTVIDKKNQDEWFVTGGYMRPETLFGTKFEGYLNERPKNLAQQPVQRIYGMNM
ncbi:conserved phage C-terminal domain-containing protein [Limosilactobacillus ingluviei]|uniref:conserved phage C-terminal domain-containing protein n=1 Tax=Limosilactobacillus ingluviei TaxID=148604 RepID=UPI0024BBB667|nr:conserved phage C-terminal domain-containing protein [Limosilactobacillus ingluviei]